MGLAFNSLTFQAPLPQNQCHLLLKESEPKPAVSVVEHKRAIYSNVISKKPSPLGTNCVAYAKSRGAVPIGMSTLEQKKSHIKSRVPSPGKIGITSEGPIGHLVYVEEVKRDTIVISEGNFIHGYITVREIPKSIIMGYL